MSKLLSTLIAAAFAAASLTAIAADAHKAGATQSTEAGKTGKSVARNVTAPKQTQGATFGEKVNQGLHAAGSAVSQGAVKEDIKQSDASAGDAAVSSVGNLAGGAGGGAAAASYAATGKVSAAPAAIADPAPKVAHKKAQARKASTKHDTAKNSVGNIR